jgi:hypothetical protein
VDRTVDGLVVGVDRTVDGEVVGVRVGGDRRAGAEPFGHPVPIQHAHPATDLGIGRVEQDLPMG